MISKNDPILTFRIALDKVDPDAAGKIARCMDTLGLKATNVTGRGLLASGARSMIEKVLHTRIDLSKETAQFVVEPQIDHLESDIAYRAYFPRSATYFSGD